MKTINEYLKGLTALIVLILVINIVVSYINFNTFFKYNNDRLESIIDSNGVDLDLLCLISNCEYISYKNELYRNNNNNILKRVYGKSLHLSIIKKYISDHYTLRNYDIHIVPKLKNLYFFILIENSLIALLMVIGYTIYYLKHKYLEDYSSYLKEYINKSKLEGRLQNIAAESAYHEMTVPVEVIKISLEKLKKTVPKIDYISIDPKSRCYNCEFRILTTTYTNFFPLLDSNIERLESVLDQMDTNKKTKYDVNTKNIYDIVITTIKSLKMSYLSFTFDYKINNEELLKRVKARNVDNGTLLNILNNQLKNALEAGASTIVIDGRYVKDTSILSLIITDNGSGIDGVEDGNYDKIFQLGYSTKDSVKQNMEAIDEIEKMKNRFTGFKNSFIKLFKAKHTDELDSMRVNSYRGFGLFITREILRNAGGDIYVYTTSTKGTVFVIDLVVDYNKEAG